ncbi:Eco57I restriction-modification methylase domain-containing protein [Acinetobacter boissieri]|uniref:Helicase conserved C-terminal domain-containing protein n=1 Tax=Acinetobacter boissieri TaxID=1219383 RepID=A0A1G6GY95_9GAMM|nr:SNF2-related protein [Acinetobacter boissieri]SDB87030.1 Helicase conserved C-terminal domain-containing protein [Acinetobacter boissieri]
MCHVNSSNALDILSFILNAMTKKQTLLFSDRVKSASVRQKDNNQAVQLLRQLQNSGENATIEQKEILAKYTGTGGNLVGEDGLKGSAYEYYTPTEVASSMWDLLKAQGFSGGSVLDPSAGTGIFSATAPKDILMHSVELSDISGGINQLVNGSDTHKVTVSPFEQVAFATEDEMFDAVMTNVPFGSNSDRGKNKILDKKYQRDTLEEYFIKRSLDKLRPNGLAMFVVPTKVLDGVKFRKFRQQILIRADLLGAYRLPNKVFDATGADVTTDIIVLKKFGRDVGEKINNLFEHGELSTLVDAQVLDSDIISGRYFKTYGRHFILGDTVTASGRFGEVERVVNDDSLSNILALVKKFPSSRIDYALLDATAEVEPLDVQEGDTRCVDGATFTLENGAWTQVDTVFNFNSNVLQTPYALLEANIDLDTLALYQSQMLAQQLKQPNWLVFLQDAIAGANKHQFDFWLCILSIIDALKQPQNNMAYSERYPTLTKYMTGYAQAYLNGAYTPKSSDFKRYLKTVSVVFDGSQPDGLSRYWHGESEAQVFEQELSAQQSYEKAIYTGNADHWQVDIQQLKLSNPDFDPMEDHHFCINADGTKVTLARDYYVGNYQEFLTNIEYEISQAHDPLIKEKLIHQKNEAKNRVSVIDVKKLQYDLIGTTVSIQVKAQFFNEFVDGLAILDAEDRLLVESKVTLAELIKYEKADIERGLMNDSNTRLRRFILNRVFNSINNNQRLSVPDHDSLSKVDHVHLQNMLLEYYNSLNVSFNVWLKSNDQFMAQLDQAMNAPSNKTFAVELDDAPLTINGFNPKKTGFIALNNYQNEEIRRLSRKFSGICGFDVGLGKTLTALASVQNMHNIGVKKRTMFVVPSHTISKWQTDVKMAYDNTDDVLVIGTNEMANESVNSKFNATDLSLLVRAQGKKYRKILITVDAFNMIPLRELTIEQHDRENNAKAIERNQDHERQDAHLATKIKKLNRYESKLAYFEDLGVDSLVFDEAQMFKNGKSGGDSFSRVKGLSLLSENTLSTRALSAAIKSWYVRGMSGSLNDGVVLLTATPFTNSPVEILTMLSLAIGDKEAMRLMGGETIHTTDDFLSTFASVQAIPQENITGQLHAPDTFIGFKNVNLLKSAIHGIANIQTARERGLKIPDEHEVQISVDLPDVDQASINDMKRFYDIAKDLVKGGAINASESDLLKYEQYKAMTGDIDETIAHPFNLIGRMSDVILTGKEMGLMRITPFDFDPSDIEVANKVMQKFNAKQVKIKSERRFPSVDDELVTSKFVEASDGSVSEIFTVQCQVSLDDQNSRLILNVDHAGAVAQLLSLVDQEQLQVKPKLSAKVQTMIENFKLEQSSPKYQGITKQLIFCDALAMQQIIKRGLMAFCGVRSSQIAIINAQTLPNGEKGTPDTEQMQAVQDMFASNHYLVVIANKKAETGIDLQIGTQAIHHLTTGWTPDSIQQRNGRGVRQGNNQDRVSVYYYNANGTFDEYKQRLISGKSDWIDQLMQQGTNVDGTLTVSRELTKRDYEELIKANNPDEIASLMKAKENREKSEFLAKTQAQSKLLYRNMMKSKYQEAVGFSALFFTRAQHDFERIIQLLKKQQKAQKDSVIQEYKAKIATITQQYDGLLGDDDASSKILNALASKVDISTRYSISAKSIIGSINPEIGYSDSIEWVDQNESLDNAVFNQVRNIQSNANNMKMATAQAFLDYADGPWSLSERQQLVDGVAALDENGVFWRDLDLIQSLDGSQFSYIKITSIDNNENIAIPKKWDKRDEYKAIEPKKRQIALDFMAHHDLALCKEHKVFDVNKLPRWALVFSKDIVEVENLVNQRVIENQQAWEKEYTSVRTGRIVHKVTGRIYLSKGCLHELKDTISDVVDGYNSIFPFDANSEFLGKVSVQNIYLKDLDIQGFAKTSDVYFFNESFVPYLDSINQTISVPEEWAFSFLSSDLTVRSLQSEALTSSEQGLAVKAFKEGIDNDELNRLLNAVMRSLFSNVVSNTNDLIDTFKTIAVVKRWIADMVLLDSNGQALEVNQIELANRIAITNTRNVKVIGLKAGDNKDNILYQNKNALKKTVKYAYWSRAGGMWIIDLASFENLIGLQWYDDQEIEIVEAKYK